MNKNISVWRGVLSPPTHHHLWLKDNGELYHYKERQWIPLYETASPEKDGFLSKTDKQIINMLNENLHWN